ncbi:MAG: hypothetical protein ABIG64_01425 [Candidatus Omnitrophota bacterium]
MAIWILSAVLLISFAVEDFFHIKIPGIVYSFLGGPLIYLLLKMVIKDAITEALSEHDAKREE